MSFSKPARMILIAAYVALLIGLGLQRLEGGFSGNWITVLLSASLFGLAFAWDGMFSNLKR